SPARPGGSLRPDLRAGAVLRGLPGDGGGSAGDRSARLSRLHRRGRRRRAPRALCHRARLHAAHRSPKMRIDVLLARATRAAVARPALFLGVALALAAVSVWAASHLAIRSSFQELLP